MKNPVKRRWGSRAGNSMLEFALGSGILVTCFTMTFQYGYIFYQYNAMFNAVNNGAHYASLYPYDSSCDTPTSTFQTRVQNMVVYGNPDGTGDPVMKNLTTANVNLTVTNVGSGNTCSSPYSKFSPGSMTVSISGYTIYGVIGSFTLNGKPFASYPYLGIYSPPTT